MARVRNSLSMKMQGRAGAYSFYTLKGRQVVRVAQNSTNYGETARRSSTQQARRVKWANLVNFYKASQNWMRGAFETKRTNQSDYNKFMGLNLAKARIALTKEEAAVGTCILDTFRITEGSLLRLTYERDGSTLSTRVKMPASYDFEDKSVAEVTAVILANNADMKEGMQLSLVQYGSVVGSDGTITTNCHKDEVTLSLADGSSFDGHFDFDTLGVSNGFLAVVDINSSVYAAWILSDSTSGRIKVSTEQLTAGNETMAELYSSPEHVAEAAASYGVDPSYFLESGDGREEPIVPVQSIMYANVNGQRVEEGGSILVGTEEILSSLTLAFSQPIAAGGTLMLVNGGDALPLDSTNYVAGQRTISLNDTGVRAWVEETGGAAKIPYEIVYEVGGASYTITFVVEQA